MFLAHDIYFSRKVEMVRAKMNLYLSILPYSLISPSNIKYENKINNNYCARHTHISNRKRR